MESQKYNLYFLLNYFLIHNLHRLILVQDLLTYYPNFHIINKDLNNLESHHLIPLPLLEFLLLFASRYPLFLSEDFFYVFYVFFVNFLIPCYYYDQY